MDDFPQEQENLSGLDDEARYYDMRKDEIMNDLEKAAYEYGKIISANKWARDFNLNAYLDAEKQLHRVAKEYFEHIEAENGKS